MFNKFKSIKTMHRSERGITGLETAIILIAFVTVASVLAYSVLSAGIFSAEKGKATVYQGLSQASSSMQVRGDVLGLADDSNTTLANVQFDVASVLQDAPVDMTDTSGNPQKNVVLINYSDATQQVENVPWTKTLLTVARGTDANMLQGDEVMSVNVDLSTLATPPGPYSTFSLQVVPPTGAAITITRTLPASISTVMDLH